MSDGRPEAPANELLQTQATTTPIAGESSKASETTENDLLYSPPKAAVNCVPLHQFPSELSLRVSVFETPKKLSSENSYSVHRELLTEEQSEICDEQQIVCSVCLSPFKVNDARCSPNVTTKCNHSFHGRCLQLARRHRASCPNCRCDLTPEHQDVIRGSSTSGYDQSELSRNAITNAAARARNAVRLAYLRRQQAALVSVE